jgi:hypothetical protein
MRKLSAIYALLISPFILIAQPAVEKWAVYELSFAVKLSQENPFTDIPFSAVFSHAEKQVEVNGFYDGNGLFKVRFMPDRTGPWSYVTQSSLRTLQNKKGSFQCVEATDKNHGPVQVSGKFHFAYADGTPYLPVGTTCYAWAHQTPELQQQTLATLAASPFNKLRMTILPKYYPYNRREPPNYPYQKKADGTWDFQRFNPSFFQAMEQHLTALQRLGIEADLILFHPYDEGHWGFDRMDSQANAHYLKYVIARFAAYRNVWWSMANEYDLVKTKTLEDWEALFDIIESKDPYKRLCSIHNGEIDRFYDHSKPYLSHVSVQHPNLKEALSWKQYGKPVINDECEYEGDILFPWGNISGKELVNRAWLGYAYGTYVGHGETFDHPSENLWWSHGGVLRGESVPRLAFLKDFMLATSPQGLEVPNPGYWMWTRMAAGRTNKHFVYYFAEHQPNTWPLWDVDEGKSYRAEVIDCWEMTISPVEGMFRKGDQVPMPARPYHALRITEVP